MVDLSLIEKFKIEELDEQRKMQGKKIWSLSLDVECFEARKEKRYTKSE